MRHVDGSRDTYTYNVVGHAYTSEHAVNDPSGVSVLIDQYRADGSSLPEQTVAANGVTLVSPPQHA